MSAPGAVRRGAPDVIIIGAGVAGLVAARELSTAGLGVVVLEARDRVGGRIFTRHTPDGPAELGAEFVHGTVRETLDVVEEAGLKLREVNRGSSSASARPRVAADAFAAMDRLIGSARAGAPDESFQQLVDRVKVEPGIKAQALRLVEGYHAADPSRISVQSLVRNTAADERPGAERQFRFVDGYDTLIHAIAQRVDPRRCELRLNAAVTAVDWHAKRVRLVTAGGSEVTAPRAILTVPLSVLQAGVIRFTPPLTAKERALRVLAMGFVVRVSLSLGSAFWAAQTLFSTDGFVFTGEAPFPVWWVSRPPPDPVVTGWAAGPHARALAGLPEDQRVRVALKGLARLLEMDPTRLGRELRGGFSHDWQADPFSRGAYSYAAVGGSTAGEELGAPLDGTLFFAGEATQSDGENATVHGAIASARRVAQEVLRD